MTIRLLRLLESSDALSIESIDSDTARELHEYSVKNRMPTCFLERISASHGFQRFKELFTQEQAAYLDMLDAVSRVSICLAGAKINHATFKTIRPYRSTTVDIDTVIFGSQIDYRNAIKTMKDAGYPILAEGPMSATFRDAEANIGIDIYNEIAVSALCYLEKEKLATFVSATRLPNGKEANLLRPEADLLALVAHSIIKEQMYTLSEYYSFVRYAEKMDLKLFVDLVKRTNLINAAKTHASITALIFETVNGKVSEDLQLILDEIGKDNFETTRITRRNLRCPHKYHPITVGRSLLEIAKGKKTRKSAALQIYKMADASFTRRFLEELMKHLARETY
jgi:hypothetical protein